MLASCSKDLGRTLDYLATRPDIDNTRVAYYGVSAGATWGTVFAAVEPRLRAAVFICGGLPFERYAPEVDPLNYAPRVHLPVLILNGRYDHNYTLEGCQRPLLRLLGTPEADKRLVLFDTGHDVPRNELIKAVLAWLDRYLGPVK
jgi:dienelactone hydrolase